METNGRFEMFEVLAHMLKPGKAANDLPGAG